MVRPAKYITRPARGAAGSIEEWHGLWTKRSSDKVVGVLQFPLPGKQLGDGVQMATARRPYASEPATVRLLRPMGMQRSVRSAVLLLVNPQAAVVEEADQRISGAETVGDRLGDLVVRRQPGVLGAQPEQQ